MISQWQSPCALTAAAALLPLLLPPRRRHRRCRRASAKAAAAVVAVAVAAAAAGSAAARAPLCTLPLLGLGGRLHVCEWRVKGIKSVVCVLHAPVGVLWARGSRQGDVQFSQAPRMQKLLVQLAR